MPMFAFAVNQLVTPGVVVMARQTASALVSMLQAMTNVCHHKFLLLDGLPGKRQVG